MKIKNAVVLFVMAILLTPVIAFATWGGSAFSYMSNFQTGHVTFSGGDVGEGDFLIECASWSGRGALASLWKFNGGLVDQVPSFSEIWYSTDSVSTSFEAGSGLWQSIEVEGYLIDSDGTISAMDS